MATEEERKNNKIQGKPSVHCGSGIVGVGRPIFLLFFPPFQQTFAAETAGRGGDQLRQRHPQSELCSWAHEKSGVSCRFFFVRTSSWVSNGSGRYRNGRDCVSQRLESTHGTGVNCPHSAVRCYRCLFTTFDSL